MFLLGCEPQSGDSQIKEESLPSLKMEVLAEIGLEDQPMEYQLGRPKGVLTDSTGNIYIADWASQSIKVFGPDGAYIRTQGRRGRGPSEFQGIHMMARTPDHSLFVMDWGGLEYEYLTMDGRQLSSSYGTRVILLGCEPQSGDSQIKEESLPSLKMEVLAEIGLERSVPLSISNTTLEQGSQIWQIGTLRQY